MNLRSLPATLVAVTIAVGAAGAGVSAAGATAIRAEAAATVTSGNSAAGAGAAATVASEVMVYGVGINGGRQGIYYVETTYRHRIIRWEMPPDVLDELTGSARLAYWTLNKNGDEKYLRVLGLE